MKRVEVIRNEFYIMTDSNDSTYVYEDKKTWLAHYISMHTDYIDDLIKELEETATFEGKEELIRGFKGLPCDLKAVQLEEFFHDHDPNCKWSIGDYVKRKK